MFSRYQAERQTGNAQDRRFKRPGNSTGVGRIVAQITSMVDAGNADIRKFFGGKNLVQRQRHAIGGCAIDRPVSFVHLTNPQRSSERQTVRRAAHLRRWSNLINVTYAGKGRFQLCETIRVDAVVVCQQNASHKKTSIRFRRIGATRGFGWLAPSRASTSLLLSCRRLVRQELAAACCDCGGILSIAETARAALLLIPFPRKS